MFRPTNLNITIRQQSKVYLRHRESSFLQLHIARDLYKLFCQRFPEILQDLVPLVRCCVNGNQIIIAEIAPHGR